MTKRSRITVGVALSGALVVAAACLALSYARQERREAVEAWRLRLIAMADDRADAVGQWVAVGRRAAQFLAACGVVRQALANSVQAPRNSGDRKGLAGSVQAELDTFARTEGYRSAYLVTEAGTVLAASAGSLAFDDTCLSAARGVLAGGEGIPEFHLHANESPLVGFAAAVASDGVPQHGAGHPAIRGAVVLESDPYAWLYPMLAREPTHTATGETVLLGRQGTDIVFLTPPRRAGAWPVGRRIRTDPAMIGALETSGRFHAGVDSRGVPIFAATSPVVGAPWSILVRVAESEALGPYRRQLRTAGLALSGFLLVLAGASFGLWRERRFAYEKTLARSEARLALLLEHANDAIFFFSLNGQILEANPRACKLHDYPREQLVRLNLDALHPPEAVPDLRKWIATTRSKDGIVGEHLHCRQDGSTFPVEASVRLVELGSERFYLTIIRDISDRRRAEGALRQSEERYRTLALNLAEGIAIVDLEQHVLFSNPAHDQIYGVPAGAMVGRRIIEFVAPESQAAARENAALLRVGQTRTFEVDILRPGGERRNLVVTASPQVDDKGGMVATIGIARDITEQKRTQAQIKLLAHSLESVGECVSITDKDDTILFVNETLLRTYGYTGEELVGKPITVLRPLGKPNDRVREILGATLAGSWHGELINRRKDGSEFPIFLSTSVVRNDQGRPLGLVGVATDLTERKRLEKQLLDARRMESVGTLAGGIAHDFNNLMQAVLGHTQLLLAHPDDTDQVCTRAREIQEQVAHGASLTRQLLVFSRREVVKAERLDLNELVRATAALLRHLIRENVTVQLDLAPSPLPIEADPGQIQQVIINLAVNASEAMPDGGQLTFITGIAKDGGVELVARDAGQGIPEGIRDRIFEPFFSTKHATEGAGLGLAVVHGIVSKHGGSIAVESEVEKGTTFRISLPRKVSGEFAVVPEAVVAPQGLAEGHGERVLLVEDEAAARAGLTEMLTMLGYEVVAVGSGEEAQALPDLPPFHLLLTDLLLPGVSGAELAAVLTTRWPGLKVIVMSGYAQDEAVRRGVAAGAVRFLQKPFAMDTLSRELRAALEPESA